jgi:hypothetical protein
MPAQWLTLLRSSDKRFRITASPKNSAPVGSPDGKWLPEIETTTDPATQLAGHQIVLLEVSTNAEKPGQIHWRPT